MISLGVGRSDCFPHAQLRQDERRLGLVEPVHFRQNVGQVDVRGDVFRVEAEGLLEAGERLFGVALVAQVQQHR